LAYGITIHKSQGSEFKVCIIIMMDSHRTMLKRNLLYTAVSRAKQKVVIVGTQSALDLAIKTEDVTKRHSRLAEILKNKYANVE
jgi:exodeoxyribonuclease V alpha subunit